MTDRTPLSPGADLDCFLLQSLLLNDTWHKTCLLGILKESGIPTTPCCEPLGFKVHISFWVVFQIRGV